jgi:hypothetical protein
MIRRVGLFQYTGMMLLLGGCALRSHEMKTAPRPDILFPLKVVEVADKSFTIQDGNTLYVAKGAPPPDLKVGDQIQSTIACTSELFADCHPVLAFVLPSGKAYLYRLVPKYKPPKKIQFTPSAPPPVPLDFPR